MANKTLCDLYTKQLGEVSEAISNGFASGQSYTIAGRKYEAHDIDKLFDLQSKLVTLMGRYCGDTCGIKNVRIIPNDC